MEIATPKTFSGYTAQWWKEKKKKEASGYLNVGDERKK